MYIAVLFVAKYKSMYHIKKIAIKDYKIKRNKAKKKKKKKKPHRDRAMIGFWVVFQITLQL